VVSKFDEVADINRQIRCAERGAPAGNPGMLRGEQTDREWLINRNARLVIAIQKLANAYHAALHDRRVKWTACPDTVCQDAKRLTITFE
jgi:hypothetical protein